MEEHNERRKKSNTSIFGMIFASIRFLLAGSVMLIYCKYKGLKITTDITDIKNLSIVGANTCFP